MALGCDLCDPVSEAAVRIPAVKRVARSGRHLEDHCVHGPGVVQWVIPAVDPAVQYIGNLIGDQRAVAIGIKMIIHAMNRSVCIYYQISAFVHPHVVDPGVLYGLLCQVIPVSRA